MAHWGVAYAIWPNYNKPREFFEAEERVATLKRAHVAIEKAQMLRDSLSPVEVALVDALADHFPEDPKIEDYSPWNDAFSDAMRKVYSKYGDDLDISPLLQRLL